MPAPAVRWWVWWGRLRSLVTRGYTVQTMALRNKAAAVFVCLAAVMAAQSTPEAGFVDSRKYTNTFFGFSLPIPKDVPLRGFSLPSKGAFHFLFGMQAERKGLALFYVAATESSNTPSGDFCKAGSGSKGHNKGAERIEIGGKEFRRGERQEKTPVGNQRCVVYAAPLKDYLLEFTLLSFDSKLTQEFQHSIESVTFFEPEKIGDLAVPSRIAQLDRGVVSEDLYTNEALGLSYQYPKGWVVADKATQEKVIEAGHQAAWGNNPAAAIEHGAAQRCTRNLLWVNKYPAGTKTEAVNPLIAMIAADPGCSHDFRFPTSIDDKEGIEAAARQVSGWLAEAPFLSGGHRSVSAFVTQRHVMLDVSSSSTLSVAGNKDPVAIFASLYFTECKGYLVAWMFVSGSQSGLDELKKTK